MANLKLSVRPKQTLVDRALACVGLVRERTLINLDSAIESAYQRGVRAGEKRAMLCFQDVLNIIEAYQKDRTYRDD